jgi:hypothetical protein
MTCPTCGLTYVPTIAADRRVHNKLHRLRVTARDRLAGIGPVPLPMNYHDREALKRDQGDKQLLHSMWSHFARSLEAWDYDLERHSSWPCYARAYLAAQRTRLLELDESEYQRLCAQFGAEASPALPAGRSYWRRSCR